jgi:hypothetical protein
MAKYRLLPLSALLCAFGAASSPAQTKPKANDVVINGESFFDGSNIKDELTRLARADGYIGATESFRQIAKAGAVMTGILNQFKNCTPKPIYVITDGGGNDIMGACTPADATCPSIKSALATVKLYFDEMKNSGVKKVMWMRYPDPQKAQFENLKKNQDIYNPEVEKICKASIEPKCQWIDMRIAWAGNYDKYTSDGIHPTAAGGTATAVAFWKAIKDSNFFALTPTGLAAAKPAPSGFRGGFVSGGSLHLTLDFDQPTDVTVTMTTLAGRVIFNAAKRETAGRTSPQFPLGAVAPGIYRLHLQTGSTGNQSLVRVP